MLSGCAMLHVVVLSDSKAKVFLSPFRGSCHTTTSQVVVSVVS